jgi:hypothetical protein
MVYAAAHECMILFGGWLGSSRGDDTWIFNCTTDEWTEVSPVVSPSNRMSSNMVYDSLNDVAILFSGYCDGDTHHEDTWVYNLTDNTWTEVSPETSPGGRYGHCMFYDQSNGRTILFSGNSPEGMKTDLWEYDFLTNTWTQLSAFPQPLGRKWGSMVYDSDLNRGFLFGGDCNVPEFVNDTWTFLCDTSEWERQDIEQSPDVRASPGLAYDSVNHLVVLFGGQGGGFGGDYFTFSDTWIYLDDNWIDMSTSSGTTTEGTIPLEWLLISIVVPVSIITGVMVWRRRP